MPRPKTKEDAIARMVDVMERREAREAKRDAEMMKAWRQIMPLMLRTIKREGA